MALIKCPECGHDVSSQASQCPLCGYPIESGTTSTTPPRSRGTGDDAHCYQNGNNFTFDGIFGENSQANFYHGNMSKSQLIKQFIFANSNRFPDYKLAELHSSLHSMSEQNVRSMVMQPYKSPDTMLLISVLVGYLGIDRFLLDNILEGVLKLILTVCCGLGLVWWIVDLFLIQNLTREYNYKQFMMRARMLQGGI